MIAECSYYCETINNIIIFEVFFYKCALSNLQFRLDRVRCTHGDRRREKAGAGRR